jgi:hypothetical protein
VLAIDAHGHELPITSLRNSCCPKEWVVETPELLLDQEVDPIDDDLADVLADGKEPRGNRLACLGSDLPGILLG